MLNNQAPSVIIAVQNTTRTAILYTSGIVLTPIRLVLSPSTPYVKGLMYESARSHEGRPWIGKNAPDRSHIGIIRKFIIIWKPCMSLIFDANAIPRLTNDIDIKRMKTTDIKTPAIELILTPSRSAMPRIMNACISPVVIPARTLPRTIENLLIGATSISFRNPNSLSQRTDIPENIDEKRSVIAIIPGARKSR